MKYFVIALVIGFLFILFELRSEIYIYGKWILSKIIFFNKLNTYLKGNIKKRALSSRVIKMYLNFAHDSLTKLDYHRKSGFILDKTLERELKYSRCDYKYLNKLLYKILEYLNLDKENIKFEVVPHISSKYHNDISGLYIDSTREIKLYINNADSFESIIATLMHEITHYFLISKGIRLKDRTQNEILTDITAVYLGFGKFMLEGYKPHGKIVYTSANVRSVDRRKIGYICYGDVKKTMKLLKYCK